MDSDNGRASLRPDRSGWMLIGVLGVVFCWNLGRVELSVTDEARSAVIVRDMVEGGRWLLPRTPDGYLCEKPLAYYGACALLGSVFGIHEWTLRGVSVLMGIAAMFMTWILARLYGPPRAARLAVVALAANVLFIGSARDAMVDMTLAFFLTAGLTAYFAARVGRISPWRAALLCGAAFGLATLSKGPLGIALPIAVAGGDALMEHRGRFWRAFSWWKQGLAALALAVALSCAWYVPGYLRGGMEFLETCLLGENFRMPFGKTKGIGVAHEKNLLYYFGVQLAAILPLLPFLPALVSWMRDRGSDPARRHLAAWLGFGFLLFEIAANKRMYYLIPLQPAVAAMIALAAEQAMKKNETRPLRTMSLITGIVVLIAMLGTAVFCVRPSLLAGLREGSVAEAISHQRGWIAVASVGLLGIGAMLVYAARRGPEALMRGAIALALFVVLFRFGVYDRLEAEFDRTRPFIASVVPKLPDGISPVLVPPIKGYSLEFYWPGGLVRDERAAGLSEYLLVARPNLKAVPPPYETLGTWKYGPQGRDDVLLLRKESPR
ncbi:MAG: glycosyltransferase family 39 protein [Planctomycetes bacterium]|nr:glycosyltransferase family 39 protein [Planctomycetota bacterium]